MADELPPRPDPQTGEPFPPHAPGYVGSAWRRRSAPRGDRPEPPTAGLGPALAWYQTSARSNILGYVVIVITFAILFSIIFAVQGEALGEWMQYWQMWLVLLLGSLLIASPLRIKSQSAGADWLAWSSKRLWLWWRPPKGGQIHTYEITEIKAEEGGTTGIHLDIIDLRGNELYLHRNDLQHDRRIWDLFYNGVIHSTANGAAVDELAQKMLELPLEVKEAKYWNWKNGNPLPNWPAKYPIPKRDAETES